MARPLGQVRPVLIAIGARRTTSPSKLVGSGLGTGLRDSRTRTRAGDARFRACLWTMEHGGILIYYFLSARVGCRAPKSRAAARRCWSPRSRDEKLVHLRTETASGALYRDNLTLIRPIPPGSAPRALIPNENVARSGNRVGERSGPVCR